MLNNPDAVAPARRRLPLRVVLVDDSAMARSLVRRVLTAAGDISVVAEAGDGGEAVQLAALLRPDVVVLDVQMPTMDAFDSIPRIRARSPHTGVVAISGLDAPAARAYALRVGADAYVTKSSPIAVLLAAVRDAAAARSRRPDQRQPA